ncbi:hypothetical protein SAMN05428953_103166 [Mesorhizobium muleiense]|uniref:Uncharacterized protein n=1 Tax=Mesorhizobium muleiense TaxID=1004279 RepID=A0A1G8P5G3_9HYPH|nr:hypothetical protein SAMN05428953_103166 [Mesorhizobium muleiense]
MMRTVAKAPSPGLRFATATLSPRGEEVSKAGASLFSPPGRRWPRSGRMRGPFFAKKSVST